MFLLTHIRRNPGAARRVFWIVMGLGHLPGLWDASNSLFSGSLFSGSLDLGSPYLEDGTSVGLAAGGLGRFCGLALTMLFIALKIRDVAFLRLCAGRRSVIAACLVVALLHVDVVRPTSQSSAIPEVTMLAATIWFAVVPTGAGARLAARFSRVFAKRQDRVPARRFVGTAWLDAARPHCWLLSRALFLMRAPPI